MAKTTERMMFESTENRYEQKRAGIAHQLRRMAEDIEREAVRDKPGFAGTPRFSHNAAAVVHEITWGFANLNLSNLVDNAAEADLHETWALAAEATPETETEK